MTTRPRLWLWSIAALISAGCQDESLPPVKDFPTDVMNGGGSAQVSEAGAVGAGAPAPDAGGPVDLPKSCRPVLGQPGPARAAIMGGEVASAAPSENAATVTVEKLYDGFIDSCAKCHGLPNVPMGKLLVTSLATFKTEVGEQSLELLKSPDVKVAMPKDGKVLSERGPNDGPVVFARRLEAWLKAGKADTFVDPTELPGAPGMEPAPTRDGPPFALSKQLGGSLTNIGNCIPSKGLLALEVEPMDKLDSMFAQMTAISELPAKLSQTDLFTLDSQQLAQQGVISFAPGYTLWADDAHKMRYVRVPRGQSIKFSIATQSFDIPDNTRFYKTFLKEVKDKDGNVGFRKMETRIIVARKSEEIPGSALPTIHALYGSYQWSEDESEATLVTEGYRDGEPFADQILEYVTDEAVNEQVVAKQKEDRYAPTPFEAGSMRHYAIPGADRCVQCHLGQPSFVLGFLPLQIMRRPVGEGGVIEPAEPDELNQLERFVDYGLITGLTREDIKKKIIPLEKSQGARSPRNNHELVAQGYMLGNCAHCHNPDGYTTRSAPLLKEAVNFMPSPDGGGIFQFPLDRVSPRIRRALPETPDIELTSGQKIDAQPPITVDIPYITPSLFEFGSGKLSPYIWSDIAQSQGYFDAAKPPTQAPWRSLIYRNVQTGFTYSDGTAIFPHMPLNTAGYDCRAPTVMAEWMLSIPSIDFEFRASVGSLAVDNRVQPYTEVKVGHLNYDLALQQAEARLATYHADPVYTDCNNKADIIDLNAASTNPDRWLFSVLTPASTEWRFRIPERPHYVKTDVRAPTGEWSPRNGTWNEVLVTGDVSSFKPDEQDGQTQLVSLLKEFKLDDEMKKFATEQVPYGLWTKKAQCNFDGIPTAGSFGPDPRWSWLKAAPDAPVFVESPGGAIFGQICVNCHGASFDAQGRQATTVSDLSGGRVTVANFRVGLFGPLASPGDARKRIFSSALSATSPDTVDDWSARYMAWMALGGTRASIPDAVLSVVGDTPVLGEPVRRLGAATPNMLEVGKVVCSALLPSADRVFTNRSEYTKMNGDWDIWRRVCGFRNLAPIRKIAVPARQVNEVDALKNPQVTLYRREPALYPSDTRFYDAYDGVTKGGMGPDVIDPQCIVPDLRKDDDPKFEEHLQEWNAAYQAASSSAKLRPRCPPGLDETVLGPDLLPAPGKPLFTPEEQQKWALRGAINAGFSVFAYLDKATREKTVRLPDYDQCERLVMSTEP